MCPQSFYPAHKVLNIKDLKTQYGDSKPRHKPKNTNRIQSLLVKTRHELRHSRKRGLSAQSLMLGNVQISI